VAADRYGNVYVADSNNHRIQKFSADGKLSELWGSRGAQDSQFSSPMRIAVDPAGFLYITDRDNNRIVKYDTRGATLRSSA